MKRTWLYLSSLLFLTAVLPVRPALAQSEPERRHRGVQLRYHAILIAHDNLPTVDGQRVVYEPLETAEKGIEYVPVPYGDSAGVPLDFTARDVARFERFLAHHTTPGLITSLSSGGAGGVEGVHRGVSTRAGVQRAFEDTRCRIATLRDQVLPNCPVVEDVLDGLHRDEERIREVVYVHFSGHGQAGGLLLADGRLGASRFQDWIAKLDADLVVVMLDSCYGAGWDGQVSARQLVKDVRLTQRGGRGVAVFRSAGVAPESSRVGGVLSHVLISGLMGAADESGDDRISFAELSDFFLRYTRDSNQFWAESDPPGGNHQEILFDLRYARKAETLSLPRALEGRVLVAEQVESGEEQVVAEVYARTGGGLRRPVELRLPGPPDTRTYNLYFLPTGEEHVEFIKPWNPGGSSERVSHFGGDPITLPKGEGEKADPENLGHYMLISQQQQALFLSRRLPLRNWQLGHQYSLGISGGVHPTDAFTYPRESDLEDVEPEIAQWIMDQQLDTWTMGQLGLVARLHPVPLLHVEARGDAEISLNSEIGAGMGSLKFARATLGAGISGHLMSRLWIGALSGGGGLLYIDADPVVGPGAAGHGLPVNDSTARTLPYMTASVIWIRPEGNLFFEGGWVRDRVIVDDGSDSEIPRDFGSFRFSLGVELMRSSW